MEHELKTWPSFYDAILHRDKTFEVRRNDRCFKVNDSLLLREYDPFSSSYTGRVSRYLITYILDGGKFGICDGFVVMSIEQLLFDVEIAL